MNEVFKRAAELATVNLFKLDWQVVAAGMPAAGAAGWGGAAGALPAGTIPIPAAGSAGAACCGGAEIAVLIAPIAGSAGIGWLGTGMFARLAVEKMAHASRRSRAAMVTRNRPVARDTVVMPPYPKSRASAAAH